MLERGAAFSCAFVIFVSVHKSVRFCLTSLSVYIYLSLCRRLVGHLSHHMGCVVFIILVRYWLFTGALSLSAACVYLCMCCFTGFWGVSWAHLLWIHLLLSAQHQKSAFSFLFRTMTKISIMQPCTYCQDFNTFLGVLCPRVYVDDRRHSQLFFIKHRSCPPFSIWIFTVCFSPSVCQCA